jgi:hypothetical protein
MKRTIPITSGFIAWFSGTLLMVPWILQHYNLGLISNVLMLIVMLLFMLVITLGTTHILEKLK